MYYRGDYYRGDANYYRGDPFIGGLIGAAARAIGVGKIASKVGRWAVQRVTGSGLKRVAGAGAAVAGTAVVGAAVNKAVNPATEVELNFDDSEVTIDGRRGRRRKYPVWRVHKGHGPNAGQAYLYYGPKMNALNPRALKRSLRRAERFETFAKRTMNALFKTSGGRKVRKFKKSSRAA